MSLMNLCTCSQVHSSMVYCWNKLTWLLVSPGKSGQKGASKWTAEQLDTPISKQPPKSQPLPTVWWHGNACIQPHFLQMHQTITKALLCHTGTAAVPPANSEHRELDSMWSSATGVKHRHCCAVCSGVGNSMGGLSQGCGAPSHPRTEGVGQYMILCHWSGMQTLLCHRLWCRQ